MDNGPWTPKTDKWWIASLVAGTLAASFFAAIPRFATKISIDLMEFCEPASLKDAARGVWTNVAVVGALLLTIIIAMLQVSPTAAQFDSSDDDADALAALAEIYIAFCQCSLGFVMNSLFICVVNLTYVEPLKPSNAIKYFIANPNSFGSPVLMLAASCTFLMLAVVVWVFQVYGLPNGVLSIVFTLIFLINTAWYVWDKATFDPSGRTKKAWEWQWTQRPQSEWPAWVFAPDQKTAEIFRSLGQAALDVEKEERLEEAKKARESKQAEQELHGELKAGSPDPPVVVRAWEASATAATDAT